MRTIKTALGTIDTEDNTAIPYVIRFNKRSKTIRITIKNGNRVVVSAPYRASRLSVETFVKEKRLWISRHFQSANAALRVMLPSDADAYTRYRAKALAFVMEQLYALNTHYKFAIGKVEVKNHKSQWGSCSSKKNIYINYRVIFLPYKLAEYVIVHELCHLREMNHSKKYWELVAETVPNYPALENELKRHVF